MSRRGGRGGPRGGNEGSRGGYGGARGGYEGPRGGNEGSGGGYGGSRGGYGGSRGGYGGSRGGYDEHRGRGSYRGRGTGGDDGGRSYRGRGGPRQYGRDERSAQRSFEGLSLKDEGEFVTSDQSVSPKNLQPNKEGSKLVSRPSYGSAGWKIRLLSNYFKMNYKPRVIYHYDIEINPIDRTERVEKKQTAAEAKRAGVPRLEQEMERKVGKTMCKKVFEKWMMSKAIRDCNPVYDGAKNVFTSEPLSYGSKATFTVELELENKTRKYEVTIQPVEKSDGNNEIDLKFLCKSYENESEVIMALNSIMNHRDSGHPQIQVGRSFFYLSQPNKLPMDQGLEIWFGHHQSVQSTERGPALLINLAAKAFHKAGPIIDYVCHLLDTDITRGRLQNWQIDKIAEALKGVRIKVTHLSYPRKYFVEGVTDEPANGKMIEGKQRVSVAEYFEGKYGRLKFPFLPCLQMRASNNQVFIPFEHCVVLEGQPKMGKVSSADMIRKTAIPPSDRFKSIRESCSDVQNESGEKMGEYGLSLENELIALTGRVLKQPSLGFSKKVTALPDHRGVWNLSGNEKFLSSITIESWILLDFKGCRDGDLTKFRNCMISAGEKVGLNFNNLIDIKNCEKIRTEDALKQAERTKAAFAVIIISKNDKFHKYDEVKFIGDYQMKFVTQCFDPKGLFKFNDQVATNLCLKINAKLGGINHVLHNKPVILTDSVMIMGADVVHFGRGSKSPSIAAVVGSVDDHAFKYDLSCRVQDNKDDSKISQELILDIRNMVKSLLESYHAKQKKHPQKIIFFRDGVSEGQFQKVHDDEISLVQKASRDVTGSIVPITFIVVQKRHQARFMPLNPNEGVGRCRNVPPGTTVDTDVVHPNRFDYFLNSHEGIQGTCKSPRYTVLHDDSKFTPDELQQLSYHLCYTYNKCNRSISIPAPVKYADLACYRAKKYADLHGEREKNRLRTDKCPPLPAHARKAIDRMGEQATTFFFI